jgi:replicative DNA helicase
MTNSKIKYSESITLPNNFLAEQAILNILLTNPLLIENIIPKLKIECFYFEPHSLIYEAIVNLSNEKKSITVTTIITYLQDKSLLEKVGGLSSIINIINRFENFSDLEEYINLVNDKYLRRSMIEMGKEIIRWGYSTSIETNIILNNIEQSIFKLNEKNAYDRIYNSAEIMDDVFQDMANKIKKDESLGLKSFYYDLDSIIQGFQNSDLIIIAGRPSMGKTAFSLNLGRNIVKNYNVPLIVFTLEMSRQQIIYRFISTEAQINANKLKTNKMTEMEWKNLGKSMTEISKLPIFIDDNPNLTILDIKNKLRKVFSGKEKQGIVIIDYLQLMKTNLKIENRAQEISSITRNLKILAKEFNVPIIVLSQLSRNVETRINKRPMLADLRESGSIEQDADVVIMLYREEYYTEKSLTPHLTEFIVAKHRNGPIGTAKLIFDPAITTFSNQE